MLLPVFVLVRVRVITDASDDDAREVVHQSRRFHFHTEHMAIKVLFKSVSEGSILDDPVPRCDETVMYAHIPNLPLHNLSPIAEFAALFFLFFLFSVLTIRGNVATRSVLADVAVICYKQHILERLGSQILRRQSWPFLFQFVQILWYLGPVQLMLRLQFCQSREQRGRWVVQRPSPFQVAAFFRLAKVPLDHAGKLAYRCANDHIAKSDLRWNTTADSNHQSESNRRKGGDHEGGNSRCRIVADPSFGQASYYNIMPTDRSKGVSVWVVRRLWEIRMSLVQHGRRRGLLLGQSADPSHSVFIMVSGLGSCLCSHCERIGWVFERTNAG
ncbi:hypothetical protein HG531_012105 [Fusarium graminearum]|nr:hypothetical protein HG531_012105 [Fusarium graminearum]